MPNPFIVPGSVLLESQRRKRQQLKVSVYAVLCSSAVLFLGMLIQGCRQELPASSTQRSEVVAGNPDTGISATQIASPDGTLSNATSAEAQTYAPSNSPSPSFASVPLLDPAVSASDDVANQSARAPSASKSQTPIATPEPPTATVRASVANTRLYTVKSGDTLTRIANAHSTTVKAIKAANGLNSDRIVVGRTLKILQAPQRLVNPVQG